MGRRLEVPQPSDQTQGQIMAMKAAGMARWQIAQTLGVPLAAVRWTVARYRVRRDHLGRPLVNQGPEPGDPAPEEVRQRCRAEQARWGPAERMSRGRAGMAMLRGLLLRQDADGCPVHQVAPIRRGPCNTS